MSQEKEERIMMILSLIFSIIGAIAGIIICWNLTQPWSQGLLVIARIIITLFSLLCGAIVGFGLIFILFLVRTFVKKN